MIFKTLFESNKFIKGGLYINFTSLLVCVLVRKDNFGFKYRGQFVFSRCPYMAI